MLFVSKRKTSGKAPGESYFALTHKQKKVKTHHFRLFTTKTTLPATCQVLFYFKSPINSINNNNNNTVVVANDSGRRKTLIAHVIENKRRTRAGDARASANGVGVWEELGRSNGCGNK